MVLALENSLFEVVTTTTGAVSIRNKKINEIMHNPVGPWLEANALYIDQSELRRHLTEDINSELVIYDVGLGAAANAIATLTAIQDSVRPVRLISFEIDFSLLQFALEHSTQLVYLKNYENCIKTLLSQGRWKHKNSVWELQHGDFLDCIETVSYKCHIIYYDPYSPKLNEAMWTTDCFRKLREKCESRAMFYNYSQATAIRVALLEAGFYVGFGQSTGQKKSTTQAATHLKDLKNPLDERWLQRWRRSCSQFPPGCKNENQLKEFIMNHEQFLNSMNDPVS